MKVLAAVVNGINEEYKFEKLSLAEMRPDEVLIKIVATGICHSDEALRVGDAEYPLPAVLGHEGAGIVEQVGSAVKHFKIGDQVVMSYKYCGHCTSCRSGRPAACDSWTQLNMVGTREDGTHTFFKEDGTPVSNFFSQSSFATHTLVHESNLVKVDDSADLRYFGPLGCGFLTGCGTVVNGLQPKFGSSIAIFGTGAVGLGALMTAKIEGCKTIIAIDIHDSRLELAKELGATHTINSKTENLGERMLEITGGRGVNYSIDTTGVATVMKAAIDVLGIGGVCAPVAVTPNSLEISTLNDLVFSNRKLIGVLMGDTVPQIAIPQLIQYHKSGQFPFEKLVKFYKFEQINEASMDSNNGSTIKPILIVDESYRADEPLI